MSTQKDFAVFLAIIGIGCIIAGCYQLFFNSSTEAGKRNNYQKHYIYVSELTDYNRNNYTYKYYTYDEKMFYTKSNMGLFYE